MDEGTIKGIILDITEASLEAQLRAVRRLKSGKETPKATPSRKGMSQIDLAYDILKKARTPLHISELIARIEHHHGRRLDRESLVSALVKKVQRQDRFVRTDKNVFGLLESGR
jgi:hypothetical protein